MKSANETPKQKNKVHRNKYSLKRKPEFVRSTRIAFVVDLRGATIIELALAAEVFSVLTGLS